MSATKRKRRCKLKPSQTAIDLREAVRAAMREAASEIGNPRLVAWVGALTGDRAEQER